MLVHTSVTYRSWGECRDFLNFPFQTDGRVPFASRDISVVLQGLYPPVFAACASFLLIPVKVIE